jgi:beta-lactamase regulating signal transducer with metallopeptidase domain
MMQSLTQSAFLHALGYTIGHSIWQVSLLWLVYRLIAHLIARTSRQRYVVATGVSIAGLVWFGATFAYFLHAFYNQAQPVYTVPVTVIPSEGHLATTAMLYYHSATGLLKSLAPYLSSAYLAVVLVLAVRMVNGLRQVKTYRTCGLQKAPVNLKLFVQQYAHYIGIKRPVALYVSQLISSPLTMGFWKPLILVPLASINQLTPSQMEAVLLHELAHIKHYDYLVNLLLHTAEILLFFNPFMRLLLHHARQERENSCDDWVLQFRYCPKDYAHALLAIEQNRTQSLLALGANAQGKFQLLSRVKRMVSPERNAFNYRQQLGLLGLVTLLALAFTVVVPRPPQKVEVPNNNILSSGNEGTLAVGQNSFWHAMQEFGASMAESKAQLAENLQQQAKEEYYRQQQTHRLSLTTALATRQLPPLFLAGIKAPTLAPVPQPYLSFAPGHPSFEQVPFAYNWNNEQIPAFSETGKFGFQEAPELMQQLERKVEGLSLKEWQWKEPENWPMLKAAILKETETLCKQMEEEKRLMATVEARQRKAQARFIDTVQMRMQQLLAKELYQAGLYNQDDLLAALAKLVKQAAALQPVELRLMSGTQALAPGRQKASRNEKPTVQQTEEPVGTANKQASSPRRKGQQFTHTFNTNKQAQLPSQISMMAGEELAALMKLNAEGNAEGAITIKITTAQDVARAMEEVNRMGKNAEKLLREMEQQVNEEVNEIMQRMYHSPKRHEQEIRIERGQNNRGAIVVQIAP